MAIQDFSNLSFMVVEANDKVRANIRQVLHNNKARKITEINNVEDVVWKLDIMLPDIIIAGFGMSKVDGISLVKTLRSSKKSQGRFLPVILLARFTNKKDIVKARDSGATEVLAVPFSAKSLYSRICSAIERPRAFVSSSEYQGPDRRRRNPSDYEGPKRRRSDRGMDESEIDKLLGKK